MALLYWPGKKWNSHLFAEGSSHSLFLTKKKVIENLEKDCCDLEGQEKRVYEGRGPDNRKEYLI